MIRKYWSKNENPMVFPPEGISRTGPASNSQTDAKLHYIYHGSFRQTSKRTLPRRQSTTRPPIPHKTICPPKDLGTEIQWGTSKYKKASINMLYATRCLRSLLKTKYTTAMATMAKMTVLISLL